MNAELIVLRILHVGGGIFWGGWVLALTMFINPAVRAMGAAGSGFMQSMAMNTKVTQVMTVVPILVVLSGWRLLWIVSAGFDSGWVSSLHGSVLLGGSIVGTLIFFHGLMAVRPTAMKLGALSASIATGGSAPSPAQLQELELLKNKMGRNATIMTWMMSLTILSMAIARYIY